MDALCYRTLASKTRLPKPESKMADRNRNETESNSISVHRQNRNEVQTVNPCFPLRRLNKSTSDGVTCRPTPHILDSPRHTGSIYISAATYNSNKILYVNKTFSGIIACTWGVA
jgi:hypothetical protein